MHPVWKRTARNNRGVHAVCKDGEHGKRPKWKIKQPNRIGSKSHSQLLQSGNRHVFWHVRLHNFAQGARDGQSLCCLAAIPLSRRATQPQFNPLHCRCCHRRRLSSVAHFHRT
ncbi:hypothetical protein DBV23_00935 [Edwardsiella ictaluri]|nr:hypothetical protein DBV23_00935 [Edwardsiella ictaluri]